MRKCTVPIPAIPLPRALEVRIAHLSKVSPAIALPVIEATARVLVITAVGQLARRSLEGLQVESEEHVLLEVRHLVPMRPVTVV